jgi:hypothetical protein
MSLLIYIIIIVFSNLYDTDIIEGLTQIYKNCISVYSIFVLFITHRIMKRHKDILNDVFYGVII